MEKEKESVDQKLLAADEKRNKETSEIKAKKEKADLQNHLQNVNDNLQKQIEDETKSMEGKLALDGEELKFRNSEILEKLEKEKRELQSKLKKETEAIELMF